MLGVPRDINPTGLEPKVIVWPGKLSVPRHAVTSMEIDKLENAYCLRLDRKNVVWLGQSHEVVNARLGGDGLEGWAGIRSAERRWSRRQVRF